MISSLQTATDDIICNIMRSSCRQVVRIDLSVLSLFVSRHISAPAFLSIHLPRLRTSPFFLARALSLGIPPYLSLSFPPSLFLSVSLCVCVPLCVPLCVSLRVSLCVSLCVCVYVVFLSMCTLSSSLSFLHQLLALAVTLNLAS